MGVEGDPMAVVDGSCRVHGLHNLVIADASVMPTIPRANTNLTVAAIAEKIAASIGKADQRAD
jgi:choline dehydrogenase-like flavoprotein